MHRDEYDDGVVLLQHAGYLSITAADRVVLQVELLRRYTHSQVCKPKWHKTKTSYAVKALLQQFVLGAA